MLNEKPISIKPKTTTMNQDIIKKAEQHNARFAVVTYRRPLEPKKRGSLNGRNVEKMSKTQVRVGLEYNNQAAVIEKHESGEVEKKGLPASMVKISRTHYRNVVTGDDMIGCTPTENRGEVKFFVDGVETPLEQIQHEIKSKDYKSYGDEKPDWIFFKVKYLVGLTPIEETSDLG
jgi:hypothetical protein